MDITVYTKPGCVQCKHTFNQLDKAGLEYTKVDVSVDEEGRAAVAALGYMALPVVVVGAEHWSGNRPDRIKALTEPKAA
jgi:glutaredoxin-like protein NrdH